MSEIWKEIPDYEGLYEVSDLGRIKSLISNKVMKASIDNTGYLRVGFSKDKKQKKFTVHRILMRSFYGDSDLVIDHINGLKTDNRIDNLEYVTCKENSLRYHASDKYKLMREMKCKTSNVLIKDAAEILDLKVTAIYNHISRGSELGQAFNRNKMGVFEISDAKVKKFMKRKSEHGRFNSLGGK